MTLEKSQNVQDVFLNHVRKNKTPVTIFLVNGVKLQGIITWFDNFCVLLRREVDHIGWSALFGSIVGAGDAPVDKPDAAPVRLALEASGIDPGETVWLVGDTGIDMECAHNSGCVPVLLGGGISQQELGGCPPRFVFSDCPTLFRFAQGL